VDQSVFTGWKTGVFCWIGSCLLVGLEDEKQCFFEGKQIKSPTEIICLICSTLIYWAGLQNGPVAEQMEQGAEALKRTALHFHHQVQMEGCDNRMAIV
jgi:hypothetical protein